MEITTEKNPSEEDSFVSDTVDVLDEIYLAPNPSEEEIQEQVRVAEMIEQAMDEAEKEVEQWNERKQQETELGNNPYGATAKIKHKGFADDSIVQQYVQYAYEQGGMDLVLLIECENGSWDMYKQSEVVKNGRREQSYGLCQIHRPDHPEIIDNKLFWDSFKWQLDRCNELMRNGTAFYGRERIIKGQKCSNYVKDRFILSD